jgi:hypothetical protein
LSHSDNPFFLFYLKPNSFPTFLSNPYFELQHIWHVSVISFVIIIIWCTRGWT